MNDFTVPGAGREAGETARTLHHTGSSASTCMTNPRFPDAVLLRSAIRKRITVKPLPRSTESDCRTLSMVTVFFTSRLMNEEQLPAKDFDFTLDMTLYFEFNLL